MNNELVGVSGLIGALTTAVLLMLNERETLRSLQALDDLNGTLRRHTVLLPASVHARFAECSPGKPTLLFFTSNACNLCKFAFDAIHKILPPGSINVCVAYDAAEGYPRWLAGISMTDLMTAPVKPEDLVHLHMTGVPRSVLLTPSNRVALDITGYVEGTTVRQLRKALGLAPMSV